MELGERVLSDERPICKDCAKASHAVLLSSRPGRREKGEGQELPFKVFKS